MQLGSLTGTFGRRSAGRTAGWLFIGSAGASAAQLLLPQHPDLNRSVILGTCLAGAAFGLLILRLPWDRWSRRATLILVPVALAMIGLGNYFASPDPHAYGVLYIVLFAWIGMSHPRWTSLWFVPPVTLAYVLPIVLRPDAPNWGASSVGLTISAGILVAEFLAWQSEREVRHAERTESIARVSGLIGPQLDEPTLCQTLTEEFRRLLGSDRAVLFRLDDDAHAIADVYGSGHPQRERAWLNSLVGVPLKDRPNEAHLASGQPVVVNAPSADDPARSMDQHIEAYVRLPILAGGELVATVVCYQVAKTGRYEAEDVALAKALAVQSGLAFENMALYTESLHALRVDALTQLGNRRAFHERLHKEIEQSRRAATTFSLMLFDIDGFREVNEAWGTLAGDRVLSLVGNTLTRMSGPNDGAYRVGGDEFALLLPGTDTTAAVDLAERIRGRVTRSRLGVGHGFSLSLSLGVCTFPHHGESFDELFERLDAALHEIKASGGDAVGLPTDASAGGEVRFGVNVRDVIDDRRIVPLYQPIVEIGSGRVLGYECFSRLDPAFGMAPAQTLFRAAEATGLVVRLDEACREIAIHGAAALPDTALLFLNISPAALESDLYSIDRMRSACASVGLAPERVVFELTERQRYPGSPMLSDNLVSTKAAGFKVALDDLGSTGSDLELLARLDFDFVKVDMSFVHGVHTDATRRRLLHGLGLLVERTGASGIAEGVESPHDLAIVRDLGFRYAQGYYLSRPTSGFGSVAAAAGAGGAS